MSTSLRARQVRGARRHPGPGALRLQASDRGCFLLLRVKDREAARALARGGADDTRDAIEPPPETALQIALTGDGLRALGVADDIVDGFAAEFVTGMANDAEPRAPPRRRRRQRSERLAMGRRRARAARRC